MREYIDNLDYIDSLIQHLQCRGSSEVERRTVNPCVEGSTPSCGVDSEYVMARIDFYTAAPDDKKEYRLDIGG